MLNHLMMTLNAPHAELSGMKRRWQVLGQQQCCYHSPFQDHQILLEEISQKAIKKKKKKKTRRKRKRKPQYMNCDKLNL